MCKQWTAYALAVPGHYVTSSDAEGCFSTTLLHLSARMVLSKNARLVLSVETPLPRQPARSARVSRSRASNALRMPHVYSPRKKYLQKRPKVSQKIEGK